MKGREEISSKTQSSSNRITKSPNTLFFYDTISVAISFTPPSLSLSLSTPIDYINKVYILLIFILL